MRANSFNTGIASEYYILSKLYRLELEAYISQGNKKSVDIRVIRDNGDPISIDVKSVRSYSSLVVNNVDPKPNHFIAFVIYNNKFEDLSKEPDVFIVPSIEVPGITETYGNEKRVMKGKLIDYKNKWHLLINGSSSYGEEATISNQQVIDMWSSVLKLRNSGLKNNEICAELGLNADELENLTVEYNLLTGK